MRFNCSGNVRQLRNEIARAVALAADGQTIARAHLWAALSASGEKIAMPDSPAPLVPSTGDFAGHGNRWQRRAAISERATSRARRPYRGKVAEAARLLGISRVALSQENQATNPR